MGLHPWWLDIWVTLASVCGFLGVMFLLIGVMMVAVEGRKGWDDGLTLVVLGFPIIGILFPLIVFVPFVALYRAVRNK